jgi:hypothetical protein
MLKPLRVAPLTDEDWAIWWTRPGLAMRMQSGKGCALWNWANNGDRRDAELMLGLTGIQCADEGVCVAYLFEIGCVINSGSAGTRIAKRGFESEYGEPRSDITNFA